jgi:hypothetical protein
MQLRITDAVRKLFRVKKTILALDLLAGVWPHSLLLQQTVSQLDTLEYEVEYLSCGAALIAHCTVNESMGRKVPALPLSKNPDCSQCVFNSKVSQTVLKRNGLARNTQPLFLSDYLANSDLRKVSELCNRLADPEKELDFEWLGTPVVRFALYETVIKFKKIRLEFSPEESIYYQATLSNVLTSTIAASKFFKQRKDYEAVLGHSLEYGVQNAVANQAMKVGLPVYNVWNSFNFREMYSAVQINDWYSDPRNPPELRSWRGPHGAIDTSQAERVQSHFETVSSAKSPFVYSPPSRGRKDNELIRAKMGVPPHARKVVLLVLNSSDEVFAFKLLNMGFGANYPGSVYPDQFEWIRDTISNIGSFRDAHFIIRMHPRELPNKREGVVSPQHARWLDLLSTIPSNVTVDQPSQKVPMDDLLEIATGVVTGWSSTALQALYRGIPVVTYDSRLAGYPSDIHSSGTSRDTYYENLFRLIESGETSEAHKRNVTLWLAHFFVRGTVRLPGRVLDKLRSTGPWLIRMTLAAMDRFCWRLWRPFEAHLRNRQSIDGKRIRSLVSELRRDLYELEDHEGRDTNDSVEN